MGHKLGLSLVEVGKKLPDNWNYKTGAMYLPIMFPSASNRKQNLFKNLAWLNKWEEQAGVALSVILETQDPNVVVVKGSKYWKDSCWKMTLWTYLVKCACYVIPRRCDNSFWTEGLDTISNGKPNIDHFLANVKQHYSKEIFDKRIYGPYLRENTHALHGFLSICTGWNPPMAKALGIVAEPAQYFKNKGITEW
jgi:predicted NBD/HSP70 family sugar kinase